MEKDLDHLLLHSPCSSASNPVTSSKTSGKYVQKKWRERKEEKEGRLRETLRRREREEEKWK